MSILSAINLPPPSAICTAATLGMAASRMGLVRPPLPERPRLKALPRPRPATALPLPVRRFLAISEAAEYVGVSVATFREEVADGRWPAPLRRGRTGRAMTWDVRALDKAADHMAGIAPAVAPVQADVAAQKAGEATLLARFNR